VNACAVPPNEIRDRRRHADAALRGVDQVDGVAERDARREIEGNVTDGKTPGVVDRERRRRRPNRVNVDKGTTPPLADET
jgi:hypothetical protein